MLQVPDLDNITYEQLLENAIHKIPQLTKEWTDFNVHDPGITTLEIYAWLIDMLNYYINASGDVHTYKYMKLLGITPQKSRCANACVSMMIKDGAAQEEMEIPKDFPVYAGNKCFTVAEKKMIGKNRFLGLYRQLGDRITELTDFAGRGGKFARVFDPASVSEEMVFLKFENALEGMTELLITVKEQENCEQLPDDFYLSVPKLMYYDGEEWKQARIIKDNTHGLLKSGVICFTLDEVMCELLQGEINGYLLKIVLEENHFDIAPEIGGIYLNPVQMVQKENLIRRLEYVLPAGETELCLKEYLADDEIVRIGFKYPDSDQWIMIENTDEEAVPYHVDKIQGRILINKDFLQERECLMDVFLIRESVADRIEIGRTDGCTDQEYELFVENPCETELLIGKEGKGQFRYSRWKYINELEKASGRDQVYTWDEAAGVFRFGDGVHGMVPEEGCTVCLSVLSVSDFEEGNVRAGEIRGIRDNRYAEKLAVSNPEAVADGRNPESLESMQKRLEEQVQTQRRLISPSDYEEQVKKIPGLKIRAAKVMSAEEYCRSHGLTSLPYDVWLVVCPENQKRRNQLSKQYEEAILKWLEPGRMLGTRIRVAAPSYTGIQISGKIQICTDKTQAQADIREFLIDYIGQYEKSCDFGAVLSHGDIFMKLEALDCVERVEELHLSPGGKNAVRNDRGDILLAGDCLPYVGEINFEL